MRGRLPRLIDDGAARSSASSCSASTSKKTPARTCTSAASSHVDLNRAGVPLVEVVTQPDMHTADEAAEFMRSLHRLVRWLEISEADMEKGQLRCDANVAFGGAARIGSARAPSSRTSTRSGSCRTRSSTRSRGRSVMLERGGASCRRRGCGTPTPARRSRCAQRRGRRLSLLSRSRSAAARRRRRDDGAPRCTRCRSCRPRASIATSARTGSRPTTRARSSTSARSPTSSTRR